MQKLEVKIVTEKEWDSLVSAGNACEHVDDESMGFADASKGKAYVRQTYWPELNKYLIQHEFEHLLEEKGTDECEHGVRHKKFFHDVIAPTLPFLGALFGGPLGAAAGGAGFGLSQVQRQPGAPSTGQLLGGAAKGGAIAGGTAALGSALFRPGVGGTAATAS